MNSHRDATSDNSNKNVKMNHPACHIKKLVYHRVKRNSIFVAYVNCNSPFFGTKIISGANGIIDKL
ncbi:MAG: hypothetical protein QME58_07465 [Bacteroidota bacterium]|nr:hypothetical protein [Bacteroidota bacterium]